MPVALEVALGVGELGRVGLGLDHVLVAGDALEGLAEIDVRAVLVGDVEEADALVEGVADDLGEVLDAQPGLVARLARADAAGAHADERDLDAGLAQRDLVGRALGQVRSVAAGRPPRPETVVPAATATVAAAVAWARKSRRFSGGVMTSVSLSIVVESPRDWQTSRQMRIESDRCIGAILTAPRRVLP